MALEQSQLDKLTDEFLVVRSKGGTLELPSRRYPGFSLDDAYTIGRQLRQSRLNDGLVAAGKKIGFTNQAIWPAMGIGHPIWATIYRQTIQQIKELNLGGMTAPKIEPEIVFGLSRDLVGQDLPAEQILAAMEWYALGFEIVDCNYPDWKCTPADAIADFGLHAALIIGEPQPIDPTRGAAFAEFGVKLYQDNELAAEGSGRDVLGSPVLAINWLLDALEKTSTPGLMAGETVTTGTLTDALAIAPGQTWRFEVNGLDLAPLTLKFG